MLAAHLHCHVDSSRHATPSRSRHATQQHGAKGQWAEGSATSCHRRQQPVLVKGAAAKLRLQQCVYNLTHAPKQQHSQRCARSASDRVPGVSHGVSIPRQYGAMYTRASSPCSYDAAAVLVSCLVPSCCHRHLLPWRVSRCI